MRFLGIAFALLQCVSKTVAESSTDALAGVPSCGLICLADSIAASSCAATNTTCVCGDAVLQANVTLCVAETCTIKETLVVTNASSTLCGVEVRDKRYIYNDVSNILGVISGVVVVTRFAAKFFFHMAIELDDWLVLLTLGTGIPSSVLTVYGLTGNGLGTDIWTNTPKKITDFIHTFYATELLYFVQVGLLKLSLLAFYARIFPGPTTKKVIHATAALVTLFAAVFLFVGIFQCYPISYYWKRWDEEHVGKCLDINVIGWSNAVISIIIDVWMLAIPISQLTKLQLHWKKKIGVAMMFMVGTFVTVISAIRLQSLVHFAASLNPTWDQLGVGIWSTVEINVGIICVCMPNLRLLLVKLFPNILGSGNASQPSKREYMPNSKSATQDQGNISIHRSRKSRAFENGSNISKDGITTSKTYAVQYDTDRDSTELELMERGAGGFRTGTSTLKSETGS